jgi:hypothetical protein
MQPLTHLAIRMSDKTYDLPQTVVRHTLVSCRHGAVWMGKPDCGLSPSLATTLNRQTEAGHATYLFIIDPDPCNRVLYVSELQGVSLKTPPENELVPGFYREMNLLARMKTWLKIGDLDACSLEEYPWLVEANRRYIRMEAKALRKGAKILTLYFWLQQVRVLFIFDV